MPDPQTVQKLTDTTNNGHFTWMHLLATAVVAGLGGGFFNPLWKMVAATWKKIFDKNKTSDIVQVAEIKKEEHTEGKLWIRVESLETKLNEEIEKRLKSESERNMLQAQVNNLGSQIEDLKRERLFNLSRYIHLKLRIGEAKKEIDYLKSKLMEKDPEFDKDYPNFTAVSESLSDEALIDQIVQETMSKGV